MNHVKLSILLLLPMITLGCANKPEPANISGKVTFKGAPVPAGWISFTPDVAAKTLGEVKVFPIENGVYDSAKQTPPGLSPGQYLVKIAGFDGKKIPLYGQGKQIFNPIDTSHKVEVGRSTKDFVVPDSAGENVRIQPTADN